MNRCPVCWNRVHPTSQGNIGLHFDTLGRYCPATEHPHSITIPGGRRRPVFIGTQEAS